MMVTKMKNCFGLFWMLFWTILGTFVCVMGIYCFGLFWTILYTVLDYFGHRFRNILSLPWVCTVLDCFRLFWMLSWTIFDIVLGTYCLCHGYILFWAILDTVLNYFLHCFGLFWDHIVSAMGIYCFGLFWIVVGYFGCCLGLFLTLFWTVLGTYFLYKRFEEFLVPWTICARSFGFDK